MGVHIFFSAAGTTPAGTGREVEVRLRSRDATLADLFRALGTDVPVLAAVDGRPVDPSVVIADSGLHEAAVLSASTSADPGAATRPTHEAVTVAGLDAGRAFPLPPGRWLVGRAPTADVVLDHDTVSREHGVLSVSGGRVTITDLGSANGVLRNGTRVTAETEIGPDDVLLVGAVALAVRRVTDADRPRSLDLHRHVGPGGTVSFNRPPRSAAPPAPGELVVPSEPGEPAKPHFSIASTVGPLVLAVIMVAVTRDLRFGLFALLSPLIGVGTYLESRRRSRTEGADKRRAYDAERAEFDDRATAAGEQERDRLRHRLPDLAEVLRRATLPSTRLWERRPRHEDFLHLYAGIADLDWTPPVRRDAGTEVEARRLLAAPVGVNLSGGGVVGIAGDRTAALSVARGLLCQAAVHHGPADLTVAVFVDPGREPEWDWAKWLPHTLLPDGNGRWLAYGRERSDPMLRQLAGGAAHGTALVVLDSDVLTGGTQSPARDLLNAARWVPASPFGTVQPPVPVAGIVLAATADRLPAACDTVIEIVDADGDATVRRPSEGEVIGDVLLAGLTVPAARACARDLARFDDPELRRAGAGLPDGVRLLPMLGLARVDARSIRDRWRRTEPATAVAPLGVTERGVFTLDLVRDGPHGLVGGTTGSGKSELLRSLVAALAANADPTQLTFVLMDYKGGAAFDECARLPHTVGLVTDLDEQLGERALRALEAELRHRERQLRAAGCDNLTEYVRGGRTMPRLIVVIDEFATLATELPDFLSALVGVAQRGRTLGVHLILATQRPSGAVNDNIRTNTNLRVALRVQDAADSVDVIGVRDAAELSRLRPGRAYVRLGPGEVVPIQTALVTCVSAATEDAPVAVVPFTFGAATAPAAEPEHAADARTDLARLVDAIAEAADGLPAPRRPWPEPLGGAVALESLSHDEMRAPVALADDPRRQAQYPVGWDPAEGNLLMLGITGSGTTTALRSIALSLTRAWPPASLELHAIDYGTGDLAGLEGLPHTGAVIAAEDRERQVRLIRHLRAQLDRRRGPADGPWRARRIVVLIDNLAAMRAEFDDPDGLATMDQLTRLYADGTAVGISFAVAADRFSTIPPAWASVTTQRWLFRLPDPYDYVAAGLTRKDVPAKVPGRMVVLPGALQAQVGLPARDAVSDISSRYRGEPRVAAPIGVLPSEVALSALPPPTIADEPWRVPIGVRESDLDTAELLLYEGEHALVAGPARCGKSTALLSLATPLEPRVSVVATGGRRSPLRDLNGFTPATALAATLAQLRTADGPAVLFIDDAEAFDDTDGAIAGLLSAGRPDLHVIAAGRSDSLRSLYGHWTVTVRRSKTGLLLRPNIDLDGDLLGVTLPRRSPVRLSVGRGYLIHNGDWDIVQVARPPLP